MRREDQGRDEKVGIGSRQELGARGKALDSRISKKWEKRRDHMGDRRKKSFENECLGEWEWMAWAKGVPHLTGKKSEIVKRVSMRVSEVTGKGEGKEEKERFLCRILHDHFHVVIRMISYVKNKFSRFKLYSLFCFETIRLFKFNWLVNLSSY
jgi:hypothetical protein